MENKYYCYRKFTCTKNPSHSCVGQSGVKRQEFSDYTFPASEPPPLNYLYCHLVKRNVRMVTGFEYTMLETIYSTEGFVRELMSKE